MADDAARAAAASGAADDLARGADDVARAGDDGLQVLGSAPTKKPRLQFWDEPRDILGRRVYRRNDLFDPDHVSSWKERGQTVSGTNLERMATGRAPVGYDGKSVDLHHLIQREPGAMAEVSYTMHKTNHGILHIPDTHSFRRNPGLNRQFNNYRDDYWKLRSSTYPN